jgi:DNA-binding Lrp family transcriptional regulator
MRSVELKLICELLKDSRRSDRELAKTIGVSQTTVSRLIKKLEKQKNFQEYTVIPDFNKLGYEILALTFIKLKGNLTTKKWKKYANLPSKDYRQHHSIS